MIQEITPVYLIDGEFTRDIAPVVQIGFIDLRVAFATGVVACDIDGVDGNFNGVESPESILGKPDDVFSAIRAAKAVESVTQTSSHPEGGEEGA